MKPSSQFAIYCLAALLSSVAAAAQRGGGMGGGGGAMGGGGMGMPAGRGGGMGTPGAVSIPRSSGRGTPPPGTSGGVVSTNRGGLQLGPPGRWWNDKSFAKSLGLNGDQQKHMDGILAQNRDVLLSRYESLQKAESRLEGLTHADRLDEGSLFTEIDRVAQARAELEKANTHYLLQIRSEMTQDQIGKLEEHR